MQKEIIFFKSFSGTESIVHYFTAIQIMSNCAFGSVLYYPVFSMCTVLDSRYIPQVFHAFMNCSFA